MLKELEQLFRKHSNNNKINPRTISKLVRENSWIYEKFFPQFESQKDLFNSSFNKFLIAKAFNIQLKKCKHCGKTLTYDQTIGGARYCSNKCKLSACENPFSRAEVKEKIKKSCLEKYGKDNPSKADSVKKKTKATCLEKYNADNPFKSEIVKEKIKASQIKKFGKVFSQTEEFKEKIEKTSLEKYGAPHKKIKDAWLKICNNEYAKPLFSLDDFVKNDHEKDFLKWKCRLCGNEFWSRWDNGGLTSKCCCQFSKSSIEGSVGENELFSFVSSIWPNAVKHFKLPGALEIDIYVPSLKLGFEFNGSYWHSIRNGHGNGYHLRKTLAAEKEGIHLVHIWEDEWKSKKEDVKKKIKEVVNIIPDFKEKTVKLDRCWFSTDTVVLGYVLKDIVPPQVVIREGNETEDCGCLVFERLV